MNTTYEISVVQLDRPDWLAELRQAVASELTDVGLHRSVTVAVGEAPPASDVPSVAVYLGSSAAAVDSEIAERVSEALRAGVVVIPVVADLESVSSDVPVALARANAFGWTNAGSAERLARLLLEELGIEDQQRRVFISHKREDGLGAAEQLHDRLTHDRFLPFIDRFAIRSGRLVQEAIADALEDHAFLLLLETPLAYSSDWVFDEVDYALSHTMGTLIVQWPGDPEPVPGSRGLPRLTLSEADLLADEHGYDTLTEAALDALVARVEAAHAHGLVRRRRMLVRSIEEAAAAAGCTTCVPLSGWRLLVEHEAESTLLGITPRLPTAEDLQSLDEAREDFASDAAAVLVHSARALRTQLRDHLSWVAGERDLVLTPENAVGSQWR
jgi:hypothetical protein